MKEKGFYKRLNMDDERETLEGVEVLSEKNSDGIYEVERLVEKKMKKVRLLGPVHPTCLLSSIQGVSYYLVLWKDYPREEASWVMHQTLHLKQSGLYHNDCHDMAELHTDCTMIHSHQLEQC